MQFINYLRETKGEWNHISWPSRRQAVVFTVLVILLSVATAFYLGAFDALFTFLMKKLIIR